MVGESLIGSGVPHLACPRRAAPCSIAQLEENEAIFARLLGALCGIGSVQTAPEADALPTALLVNVNVQTRGTTTIESSLTSVVSTIANHLHAAVEYSGHAQAGRS